MAGPTEQAPDGDAATAASVSPAAPAPRRPRRWLRRTAWIAGGTVVVLLLVVFVLPSPLARYLIGSQLDTLGIAHEGLGTVEVDLNNRRFRAGPIALSGDDVAPAKLGSVEATYSITNLFKRRAFIETFALTGVDIRVRRLADGTFKVNGIDPDTGGASADDPDGKPFGYGVNSFVFTDSKLYFEDVGGGALTLDLERLELTDFRSWAPEAAGRYDLLATLNGMKIRAKGEATPFAETIQVNGALGFDSLTLDGIAAFVGETGLTRQAGAHAMDIRHAVSLSPDGALKVKFEGASETENADLATELGDAITIAGVENTFDAEITLSAENVVDVAGAMSMQVRDLAVIGADGAQVVLPEGRVALSDMNLRKYATLREGKGGEAPEPAPADAAGKPITLVQLALRSLIALGQEVLRYKLEGAATVTASASDLAATQPDGSRLALGGGEGVFGPIEAASDGPFWTVKAPLTASLAGIEARTPTGTATIGQARADVRMAEGRTDFVDRSLAFDLALIVDDLAASEGDLNAVLRSLALKADRVAIAGQSGAETLETALTLEADGLEAARGGPSPAKAEAETLKLTLDRLAYDDGLATANLDGRLDVTAPAGEAEGVKAEAAAVGAAMRGFVAQLQPSLALSGGIDLIGSNLHATEAGSGLDATLGRLEASTDSLKLSEAGIAFPGAIQLVDAKARTGLPGGDAVNTSLARVNVTGLSVAVPKGGAAAIGAASIRLNTVAADTTGATQISARLAEAEAKDLDIEQPQQGPPSLKAASIRLAGGTAHVDGAATGDAGFASVTASGLAVASAADGGQSVTAASVQMSDATARLEGETAVAGGVARFEVSDIAADRPASGSTSVRAAGVQMSGVTADMAGETPLTASLGGVAASDFAFAEASDAAVSVGASTVRLTDAAAKLGGESPIEATLKVIVVSALEVLQPAAGAPRVVAETVALDGLDGSATLALFGDDAGPSGGAAAFPSVRVGQLTIAPGGRFALSDASAGETLRFPLAVDRFDVGPIDTAAPTAATSVDVALQISDKASATIKGTAAPLADDLTFDLTAALSNFPLPLASPIVAKFTGLTVESGALTVAASGKTANGALGGKVDLQLRDFYVGEPDAGSAERFKEKFGVSPDFAVGLLKDGNGVIDLSLPVGGTAAQPVIDYGDVISQAIGGALASLFPSGAVKGEAGFGVEIIPFGPGETALGDAGRAAADRIAGILAAKSDIRLRICGKGARADLLAIREAMTPGQPPGAPPSAAAPPAAPAAPAPAAPAELEATDAEAAALLALAQERATALRQRLTDKGVASSRIGDCRTSYSATGSAPPRAEVQL